MPVLRRPKSKLQSNGVRLALSLFVAVVLLAALVVTRPVSGATKGAQETSHHPKVDSAERGSPRQVTVNDSYWEVWFSGLPPNVSASYVFGQFSAQSGSYVAGHGGDGFDGGGGPLFPGVYDLYVQPASGYIPVPASATYFVTDQQVLNASVSFVLATPCYQVFTEVGLPQGSEWWVIGAAGQAFFANNSDIDATGCGGSSGIVIGTSANYQIVNYPPAAFYPPGATIPVFFASQSSSSDQFPATATIVLSLFVALVFATVYAVRGKRRRPPPTSSDGRG